jgi:hypothetical protein
MASNRSKSKPLLSVMKAIVNVVNLCLRDRSRKHISIPNISQHIFAIVKTPRPIDHLNPTEHQRHSALLYIVGVSPSTHTSPHCNIPTHTQSNQYHIVLQRLAQSIEEYSVDCIDTAYINCPEASANVKDK